MGNESFGDIWMAGAVAPVERSAAKGIAGSAIAGAIATYRWADASDRAVRDVIARK